MIKVANTGRHVAGWATGMMGAKRKPFVTVNNKIYNPDYGYIFIQQSQF